LDKSLRLIDIAFTCGFSSHAQLSRVFRQVIGKNSDAAFNNALPLF
jgi:transcriptional regulator GlxA family with amidase domain